MKAITGLYIMLAAMHLVHLTNMTLFKGEWDGIAMWLSTGLFIGGTAYYLMNKKEAQKKE